MSLCSRSLRPSTALSRSHLLNLSSNCRLHLLPFSKSGPSLLGFSSCQLQGKEKELKFEEVERLIRGSGQDLSLAQVLQRLEYFALSFTEFAVRLPQLSQYSVCLLHLSSKIILLCSDLQLYSAEPFQCWVKVLLDFKVPEHFRVVFVEFSKQNLKELSFLAMEASLAKSLLGFIFQDS